MITIEQIKAARALLGWSQSKLADHASLSQTGIARIENGTNQPNTKTLEKIQTAFDDNGIEFIENGVKKRTDEIRTLKGRAGFLKFLNEMYETIVKDGGLICLYNAKPDNWYKWLGEDVYKTHAQRMYEINNNYKFRIITEEGEKNLISSNFAEYKVVPKEIFNEQSIYAFGNTLAFINFDNDDIRIHILKNADFAKGFQDLFNITWNQVAKSTN